MTKRIFGTDGVRGRAGEGWLSPPAVAALGRAAGQRLGRRKAAADGPRRALLAHDGRRSGPTLHDALGRGLAAGGFTVESAGLVPTPALAWLVRQGHYVLGGMVSASHNPAEDNGIKLFAAGGEKLSDDDERAIEEDLLALPEGKIEGPLPTLAAGAVERYRDHMVGHVGAGLRLAGLRIALDCANGAGSTVAPAVLERLGADVVAMACAPDGLNINRDCGSTHPQALQALVRRSGAQLGVALDGDGDRCLLVEERGQLVDGDALLALLARHAVERGEWDDRRLVATVMSNKGLQRALRDLDVRIVPVDVGDRHVVEALRREGLRLGGEQSGHIVFGADHHYIGDGTYTALRALRVMTETGRSLSDLASCFRAFPQVLVNVRVARKPAFGDLPAVGARVAELERQLGEDGRVLLRYSGTEPLARVMVEGPELGQIELLAESLAQVLRDEIGA